MGEEAVALAKAVKYKSAGTVEFIVDKNRKFYFLEMNTRLQVEHPVTELITGLDLVELMIRVAAGEKLPFQQKDVKLDGWAVEARLYAEDPFRNFLPSTGRLVKYREPAPGPDVRVDTGVYEGGEISMFYDPMIAKLCTYGKTRIDAIERMRRALDEFYVRGVSHNVPFLAALMAHPRFREGRLTTNFIAEEFKGGFTAAHLPPRDPAMLAGVAAVADRIKAARLGIMQDNRVVMLNRDPVALTVTGSGSNFVVDVGGRHLAIETDWSPSEPLMHAKVDGQAVVVQIDAVGSGWRLIHEGGQAEALVLTPRQAELYALMPVKAAPDTSKFLLSPMPGLLASVAVSEGQEIKTGEVLAVVEAMKMENVLRATRDGTVKTLHAKAGDSLRVDQKIIEFA
jgi:propionyl-CoA carboxylase alpha chain